MTVTRPALRYHGGKFRLAQWIIEHLPTHRVYVEPYGGAASVLLRKQRSYAEVYNDLDGEIVNLFRVLRNPAQARELIRLVKLTPYARAEFDESYITAEDPIEQARRTMFRSLAGFSTTGATGRWRTGFRANVTRTGTSPARDWRNFPDALEAIVDRLRGVVIEHDDAAAVIARYDTPATLFYVDPPYPHSTRYVRWAGEAYAHEMSDDDHAQLAHILMGIAGMAVVSGYNCDLYESLYGDWQRVEHSAHADGAKDRIEVLWLSPKVKHQPGLFSDLLSASSITEQHQPERNPS